MGLLNRSPTRAKATTPSCVGWSRSSRFYRGTTPAHLLLIFCSSSVHRRWTWVDVPFCSFENGIRGSHAQHLPLSRTLRKIFARDYASNPHFRVAGALMP